MTQPPEQPHQPSQPVQPPPPSQPPSQGYPPQQAAGSGYPPPPQQQYQPGTYPPAPPQPYSGYAAPPATPKNGMGTTALVLGVIGLVTSWLIVGIVFGLIAVILGFVGRGRVKRGEATNGGVALAGIVLGFLAIIIGVVCTVFYVMAGSFFMNELGGRDFVDCMNQAGDDQAAQQACADEFQQTLNNKFSVTLTPTP